MGLPGIFEDRDPNGPDQYPDYGERLAWWKARAGQVERWKAHRGKPDHVTLGEPDTAVEYYRKFVAMWRDADPGLQPRVAEAEASIARLTN